MASEKEIEELIKLLDGKTESGVNRINIQASENMESGKSAEIHHHGRCDVGSPWAKGTVKNFDCQDIPEGEQDQNE